MYSSTYACISRPSQSGSVSVVSNSVTECEPGLFDSKNKVMNHRSLSFS